MITGYHSIKDKISDIIWNFKDKDESLCLQFLRDNIKKMSAKQKYHFAIILHNHRVFVDEKYAEEIVDLLFQATQDGHVKSELYLNFFGNLLLDAPKYQKPQYQLYRKKNQIYYLHWYFKTRRQTHPYQVLKKNNAITDNWKEAGKEVKKMAKEGVPPAQLLLAEAYKYGVGMPKSPVHAFIWAKIAQANRMNIGDRVCNQIKLSYEQKVRAEKTIDIMMSTKFKVRDEIL